MNAPVTCNGRTYPWPTRPTVVVCIDGSEPGYIEAAIAAGRAPTFARFMREGASLLADSVVPSFTNPNNLSIVTGRPPSVHGIAGNYFLEAESGREVMMNDPRFLRAPTILAAFHAAGARVAVVTAKDKLRLLLSHGLDYESRRAIAFSTERADRVTLAENGIADILGRLGRPLPDVYSAALSEVVLAAGVELARTFRPDLMYLSTTDYVQHKAGPGSALANDLYAMLDGHLAALDALGATIVVTADHGMNDKHHADGTPDVIYLQTVLDDLLGVGAARVILPITDPYVVHHGALGSFACVHLADTNVAARVIDRLGAMEGIDHVASRADACRTFELPADRIGDVVVVSSKGKVLGTAADRHDLSGLDAPLRSHGGIAEQRVPIVANCPLAIEPGRRLRNFDAFALALEAASLDR
jgi:phosphonoacetate hydrolase